MKIGFTVGAIEQHQLELSFDQPSGDLRLLMDGTQVLQDTPKRTRERIKRYELRIGEHEKHKLALQLTFEDEQARQQEEQQAEPLALQFSFGDQMSETDCEPCPDWPVRSVPRFSLMVSAVGD